MKKDTKTVLGIVVLVIILSLMFSGSNDPQPVAPRTPAPVVSSLPKESNIKVEAPVKVESPVPIAEPPVTNPASGLNTEESIYLNSMVAVHETMGQDMIDLGDLMQSAKIGDNAWTIDVVLSLYSLEEGANTIKNTSPPTRFQASHDKYVTNGVNKLLKTITLLPEAIDELDSSKSDKALVYLAEFTEAMETYLVELTATMKK